MDRNQKNRAHYKSWRGEDPRVQAQKFVATYRWNQKDIFPGRKKKETQKEKATGGAVEVSLGGVKIGLVAEFKVFTVVKITPTKRS
jgi:hypothetical protein